MRKNKLVSFALLFIVSCSFWVIVPGDANASSVEELQRQINEQNEQVGEMEKDIKAYEEEIQKTLNEADTLKNEIQRLDATGKKLQSSISVTEKKIFVADSQIERLTLEIQGKETNIGDRRAAMAEIMRNMGEAESQTMVEIIIGNENFSDFFGDLSKMDYLHEKIAENLNELKSLKETQEKEKNEQETERKNLQNLKTQLSDQKDLTWINKNQKNKLLTQTKNKESSYRNLLEEKKKQKEIFEAELLALEAQLQIEIDPSRLPGAKAGVLMWPLDSVFITQYFGNTPFSTQNPQIYNGQGHTGVDFRASLGTPVKTSLSGVVEDIGNTDLIRGCYSFGKWVLIRHNNGLSTLYAHLSLTKVGKGQQVATGQLVGYSGDTGYATGPHLHFGVYASQGIEVTKFTNSKNCKNAYVPIADRKAYLNPMSYLPKI